MRINGSDLSVTLVGGLTCVFMYVGIPLWAVFIGWAWYYVMGSRPKAIKQGVPPTLAGAVLAILGLLIIDWLTPGMGSELATGVGLLVTMFLLMLFFKIPGWAQVRPWFCPFRGIGMRRRMSRRGCTLQECRLKRSLRRETVCPAARAVKCGPGKLFS